MKSLKVGRKYVNKGRFKSTRKILALGDEYVPYPRYNENGEFLPNLTGVLFEEKGRQYRVWSDEFAHWMNVL